MLVTSKSFGTGILISKDETTCKVVFDGQVKNLALRFANLTLEDGTPLYIEPKKVKKNYKKNNLPMIDYSKYSDAELVQMYNDLMSEFAEAKSEARKDLKTGTR